MKIGINLTREHVGGITASNLNLMNYLYTYDFEFVGIELTNRMYMKGASLFRLFNPLLFDHHIINVHHLPILGIVEKSKTLKEVHTHFSVAINLLREIIKDTSPDVVLLSDTYYHPWLISVAARLEKKPTLLWYSGILAKETEHFSIHTRKIFMEMERDIAGHATTIVFPSQICKEVVERDILKRRVRHSYVIPNPVSPLFTDLAPTELSVDHSIAAIGRYTKIKNFDYFFALHKELKRRKWKHTASFVTNADVPRKKIPHSINILPPMAAEGLRTFYLSQGLIVCPSEFETFGNVAMEAACLGIPVLVSDSMGCAEILKKVGLTNMVISFTDIGLVADRIQELCGQTILPKQMNALRRLLDNKLVSEEMRAVLVATHEMKKS